MPGGAEAVIHATRRYVEDMPADYVTVKLDFSNAFNSVRRDLILDTAAANTPEIYRFTYAKYSCEPKLIYGPHIIRSKEGSQQGDPLSSLEFCDAVDPTLKDLNSEMRPSFMDDVSLSGHISTVAADVETIIAAAGKTGLHLNRNKCEIIANDFNIVSSFKVFDQFRRVKREDLSLLGAPILKGSAVDTALRQKIKDLDKAIGRLTLLHSHDALTLLKNSMSMPKLLYTLRTSECSGNPLLEEFDKCLRDGLTRILNVDLSDDQWLQASLPVRNGGLGIRNATKLAPSAFLASAASTRSLQDAILPQRFQAKEDISQTHSLAIWKSLSSAEVPAPALQHVQKAWDGLIASKIQAEIWGRASDVIDKARLLAAASPHSGDWLHAPPISSIGLRLDNEMIRVSVGLRLGAKICEPHTCHCQKMVDPRGLHGLSCRRSAARQQRHAQINDIIHRAILRTQTPSSKEPVGLIRNDGKRPDGATLIPWSRGKPLAWDVTVVDTFADSHIHDTSSQAGEAANKAAAKKTSKYSNLTATHIFAPIAMETAGSLNNLAIETIEEIGKRTSAITKEPLETTYLFQRISMAIQRGNAVSFSSTFQID